MARIIYHVGRIAAIVILAISAGMLVFWPLLEEIIPGSSPTQLFGVVVATLAALVVDLSQRTKALGEAIGSGSPKSLVEIEHLSIGDSVRRAVAGGSSVGTLRVMGSTSEVIVPAIRDSHVQARNCRVMLQDFSLSDDARSKALRRKTDSFIETWLDFCRMRVAEHVEIRLLKSLPSTFLIIFDERCVVLGLFFPIESMAHAVNYLDPMYIEARSPAGELLVKKFIEQFDAIYETLAPFTESSAKATIVPAPRP